MTERNGMFCVWSDKIPTSCWYGGKVKVAVIRKECEMYTTVVLFIESIACWDSLTSFEYSDKCGKYWTMICCFLQVYKGKRTDILIPKAFQTLGNTCEILFIYMYVYICVCVCVYIYILYFNLWNQSYGLKRERAEGFLRLRLL